MRYKKIIIFFIVSFLLVAYFPECFETKAAMENEYLTYQEIIMSSGKLIKNFTNEEKANAISKINYTKPFEVAYYFDNQNVEASYISETTELIENNGTGVIERNVSVVVETNKKVTLNMSGSVASTTKSNLKSIKNEITSKAGVEYSTSTTKSVKEVNEFLVKVEPNSQYMIVVEGRLRISNGAVGFLFFTITEEGLFEIVTIESQFYHYEVRYL